MSNNMKFLLLNITLLAGMYCNCEYSRCAGCCKNCCDNGDNENGNKNNKVTKANKIENEDNTLVNNNNQLPKLNNNDINNVINEDNNEEEGQKNTKDNEEHNVLYFKIQEGVINNNDLGCFGNFWFNDYIGNNKKEP